MVCQPYHKHTLKPIPVLATIPHIPRIEHHIPEWCYISQTIEYASRASTGYGTQRYFPAQRYVQRYPMADFETLRLYIGRDAKNLPTSKASKKSSHPPIKQFKKRERHSLLSTLRLMWEVWKLKRLNKARLDAYVKRQPPQKHNSRFLLDQPAKRPFHEED